MKEKKFRAWDKEKKYFYYFSLNSMFPVIHQEEMINKEEPQQHTGLKDKNVEEIYEGDILCNSDGMGDYWQVVDSDGAYHIVLGNSLKPITSELLCNVIGFEIVGNVYETTKEQKKEWGIQ